MNTLRIFVATVLLACGPALAGPLSIHGEPAATTKAVAGPELRLGRGTVSAVTLGAVTAAEMGRITQANRHSNKRTAVGIERTIGAVHLPGAADLHWKSVEGGYAAQVAVSSPEAGSLRLAVDLAGVPPNVEMVAFGSGNPSRLEGPVKVGDIIDRTQPWWSPITDGDTQTIEFFVPSGADPSSLPLRITGVSHLFTTLGSGMKKRTADIGEAGSCEIDVKCSSLFPSLAFQNMRDSVAQMVLVDSHTIFLCSGQLLNDTDTSTQIPYFFSANHCLDNEDPPYKTQAQMQVVANTISTLWFFEAVTCSNPSNEAVPAYAQVDGGATYLYSDQPSDALMVKLNGSAPSGAYFAGWDAAALPLGTAIVVAHHPEGDLKKVSQGSLAAYSRFPGTTASNLFNEVKYSSGTTEPGSSGAGLFSFDGTEYKLRGALFGGGAACDAITASDWYSQFDKAYPQLQQYLTPPFPVFDYTDLWWNPNESGWGLNLVQHASHQVFGVWFAYRAGGTPTWYTIPGGKWTTTNTFTGAVYATTGPAPTSASFNAQSVVVRQAGTATLTFSDANNGTFAYTVDGVTDSKSITRQPY